MIRHLRDAAQFGAGNLLYLLASVYWTFELPRQLSLERFADWRLFVLYGSFVGVLHGGALDAMLYRWSRRRSTSAPPGLWSLFGILSLWHLTLLGAWAFLTVRLPLRADVRILGWTLLAFALVWNLTTCLQYALQARRKFGPLSLFVALHAALMSALVVAGVFRDPSHPGPAWAFACSAAVAGVIVLVPASTPFSGLDARPIRAWALLRKSVEAGFPILLVNLLLIVLVNSDRIAVSIGFSRPEFAVYAFAASVLALVNSLTSVAGRFAVPYVARWVQEDVFERWYAIASAWVFCAWALALGGCLLAGWVVRRYIPTYGEALPIVEIMAVTVAFGAPLQILHLNYARSSRRTFRSTVSSIAAVVLAIVLMSLAVGSRSLEWVAWSALAIFFGWWLVSALFVLPGSPGVVRTNGAYAAAVSCLAVVWLAVARHGTESAHVLVALGAMASLLPALAAAVLSWRLLTTDR